MTPDQRPPRDASGSRASALLRAAADDLEAVERERDEWRRKAETAVEREQDIARTMYRKGYLAGRAAKRRGDPAVTNPERHARGEARRLLTTADVYGLFGGVES